MGLCRGVLLVAIAAMAGVASCDGGGGGGEADPCADVTCGPGTHCVVAAAGPLCKCDAGLIPDEDACRPAASDPCDPNPCAEPGRGACEEALGEADGYACSCDPGYREEGDACVPEGGGPCDPNPCEAPNRTRCQAAGGLAVCACDEGFVPDPAGEGCVAEVTDPCDPNPCEDPHRTVCEAVDGQATCACDPGYEPRPEGGCALPVDPCDPNPCAAPNQGVCEPGPDGATCLCDPGYEPDGQGGCVTVVEDPCDPNPCTGPNQGTCEVESGEAICRCDDGLHDDGQGGCTDDPCAPNPCEEPHQTACTASGEGWICGCDPGYETGSDGGCVPEVPDPCEPNPCDEPLVTMCEAVDGQAVCGCDEGAHPDGQGGCTLDPCTPNPCDAPHQGVCEVVDGEGGCGCDPGYHLYEGACVDACTPNPCTDPGKTVCEPSGGQAVCSCDAGLHPDGQGGCTDDPCLPDPCAEDPGTVCVVDGGSTTCQACLDLDGDGYGVGPGCLGPDCDDAAEGAHEGCPCAAAHDEGDAHEQDECFFLADALASGEPQDHTIAPAGDVDWVTFETGADHPLRIVAGGDDTLRVTLVSPGGLEEVAYDVGSAAVVEHETTQGGPWLVRIEAKDPADTISYTLTLVDHGPDDHADGPEGATVLPTDGTKLAADLEIASNVDWFRFEAVDGHLYEMGAQGTGQGVELRLYDHDGITPVETDDASYGYVAYIDRGQLTAGSYWLRVRAETGNQPSGPYQVWVKDLGPDDHGDDAATATGLPTDASKADGSFEVGGNTDWFSFEAAEGHMYQVRAQGLDGQGVDLRLFDTDGETTLESTGVGYDNVAFIDRGPMAVGTYFLRLAASYGSTNKGAFQVWVTDLGPDDHAGSAADATALPTDGTQTAGLFQVGGNTDWFSFQVEDGHLLQLRAQADGAGVKLGLFDADGETLLVTSSATYDHTAFIDRGPMAAGTYYLRVRPNYGSAQTGSYQVWIEDLGLDDHGGSFADATPLPFGGDEVAGLFEVAGNTDWFTLDVPEGHMVQLWAQADGTGVKLYLHDTDGETLLESSSASYSNVALIDRDDLPAGTYGVRARPNYGNASTGSYAVWAVDLGPDDHPSEPVDTATVPVDGTEVSGAFEVGDNVDYLSFAPPDGHMVQVRAATDGTGVRLRLYDADGETLLESKSASYSNTAMIDRDDLGAGPCFLRLSPYTGHAATGSWRVWITDLGPDDHASTAAGATVVPTGGTPVDGAFEVGDNTDWFTFQADGTSSYEVAATPSGTGVQLRVYSADGETLVDSDSASYSYAADVYLDQPALGAYFVKVFPNYGNASTGPYQVSVTAVAP